MDGAFLSVRVVVGNGKQTLWTLLIPCEMNSLVGGGTLDITLPLHLSQTHLF